MKVMKFKVFFFIPLIYILIFVTVFSVLMNGIISPNAEPRFELIGGLFAVIFPLHLFAMFCIFYSLYFAESIFYMVFVSINIVDN